MLVTKKQRIWKNGLRLAGLHVVMASRKKREKRAAWRRSNLISMRDDVATSDETDSLDTMLAEENEMESLAR